MVPANDTIVVRGALVQVGAGDGSTQSVVHWECVDKVLLVGGDCGERKRTCLNNVLTARKRLGQADSDVVGVDAWVLHDDLVANFLLIRRTVEVRSSDGCASIVGRLIRSSRCKIVQDGVESHVLRSLVQVEIRVDLCIAWFLESKLEWAPAWIN